MTLENTNRASGAAVWFVLAVILFAALALAAKFLISVPAIDADRAAVRSQALAEMQAADEKSLNTLSLADSQRGIVHLPVETAMKLAVEKWPDAAAARADLKARIAKATAPVKAVSFE